MEKQFSARYYVRQLYFKARRLVVGLSSGRRGFDSRRVIIRFLVEKVALGKIFLQAIFLPSQHYVTIFTYMKGQ
jgi:hypothetical protein